MASTAVRGPRAGCRETMRQYYPLMPADDPQGQPPERPDYKVYRSRPGLLSRLRISRPRKAPRSGPGQGAEPPERGEKGSPKARPTWRRVLKWVGVAALVWILISFVAFEISSQIQRSKLVDMGNTLHGNPFLAVSPQNILVIGTDIRSGQFAGPNEAASKSCLDAAEAERRHPRTAAPTGRTP